MIQVQIVELPGHPFFIGAQFHPEFKSRPGKPSPLFSGIFSRELLRICHSNSFIDVCFYQKIIDAPLMGNQVFCFLIHNEVLFLPSKFVIVVPVGFLP